jgi:hypothetical protein
MWYKQCIHKNVITKIIPVETVPRIRGEGMKESGGEGEYSMIYLIHCKNLCKCHNVPPTSTIIKGIKTFNIFLFSTVAGIEPRASLMLGQHSITKSCLQPFPLYFNFCFYFPILKLFFLQNQSAFILLCS